jgi:hypothetical protein
MAAPKKAATRRTSTTAGRKTTGAKKTSARTGAGRKKTTAKKTATKKVATRKPSAAKKAVRKVSGSRRKYSRAASESVHEEMREMEAGKLRSGGSGKKVTSRKQAIAIGLSEARRAGKTVPPNPNR